MLPVLEEQKLFENVFDTYFADIVLAPNVISWVDGLARVTMPRYIRTAVEFPELAYESRNVMLTGLGTPTPDYSIPGTLLKATYLFKFRVLPEDRLEEDLQVQLMWYGGGFRWGEGWGLVGWPLFRIVLDAKTNRLSLIFDGYRQVVWGKSGRRNTYPFVSWAYDLGHVNKFKNWNYFATWLDLETKTFKRMWIGEEIPWPTGYEGGIHPTQYAGNMVNGMFTGRWRASTAPYKSSTNVTFEVDDVEVWTGYHVPPPIGPPVPPGAPGWWWLIFALGPMAIGAVLQWEGERVYKGR